MLESVPIIPFHNSFNFILLFLTFSPIIPEITPHQVEPRPGENKNFINIMVWSWKFRQDFQFYLKFAYWLKKQIMHNVISSKILRIRRIQRRYTHARPGASLWADGAYAIYGIYVGTMTSYRHVSQFPLLSMKAVFH